MAMMRVEHQFTASKRMYKEKLSSWGFSKNLKKGTVRGIVRRANHREGRQTEVLVNGTKVALDRVQKAYDRHFPPGTDKAPEDLTPTEMPDVVVQTPASVTNHSQSAARHRIPAEHVWTPSNRTPATDRRHFESDLLQTEGRGLPLTRLMELRKNALDLFARGKNAEAAYDLRTALCGLRHVFGATYPLPAQTGYDLAEIYESDDDPDKADSVLNWMSETHVEEMGLWHPDTLQHYLRIIGFLQASSRYEQAKLLGFRIYHAVRDSWGPRRAILIPSNAESDASSPEALDLEVMDRIFAESSEGMIVSQQLKIANLWATAAIPGMENLLQRLVNQCERHPASLAREALEARCCLIKKYIATGASDLADSECKIARDNLAKIILDNTETIPDDVLTTSIELASLHLQHNNANRCARVVTWTADILEGLVSNFNRPQFEKNTRTAITYFTTVGLRYQEQSSWEDAAPWFERALALVSKVAKCPNPITILLEDAIDRRSFTFDDLHERFLPEIAYIGLYVYIDLQ
ncbi:hypothetical protein B0J13DRAFT_603652 [Dactylonectria estremocensis]|uniref:Clr5 domain-containing protein n=1 Tax=Dactylonectria estremocensis TaxID=1079267 RepID=A0A9P9JBG3_9HYPO|nr:hypothetical protein B0J13DRAFT_603652 [Dactylonectria estremocensis]